MPQLVLLISVLLGLATHADAEQPAPEDLLDRAIAYHDPEGRFLSQPHRMSFLESRPSGSDRQTEALIDVPGGRFEISRRDEVEVAGVIGDGRCAMTLNGRSDVSDEERKKHRLNCERLTLLRDYYTYLWGLPMKLRDPGTHLGEVSTTTFDDQDVYSLRVTYDPDVGGDTWYFYFRRSDFALVGYRFYHDESKNDGEVILLEGELEAAGLRLPKSRAWYTHQDDRHLGTDVLTALENVKP